MAFGEVSSPAAWYNGTIAPPTWFQNIQDNVNVFYTGLLGDDHWFFDDFRGNALKTGEWVESGAGTSVADDTANGGSGVATLTDSATDVPAIQSVNWPIGTSDFFFSARVRVSAMGGANSYVDIGVPDTSAGNLSIVFRAQSGNANWQVRDDFDGSIGNTDSGVAYGTTTYQRIEIQRTSDVYVARIDGTQVYTSSPGAKAMVNMRLWVAAVRATSGTTTAKVDYVKFYANR